MDSYTEIYDIAERYFAAKRAQLVALLQQQLINDFRQTAKTRPLHIVDFGSGDGRLIRDIIAALPDDMQNNMFLTCVEPDDSNFAELQRTFNNAAAAPVNLYKGTAAKYLADFPQSYDACLMTHMLYHIPLEDWSAEIDAALKRTAIGGKAYITLVEREGDAYRIAAATRDDTAVNDSAIGGDYIFAEHLDAALETMKSFASRQGVDIEKLPNKGNFNIPKADIDLFTDAARNSPDKLPQLPFVKFMGFILRQSAEEIAANAALVDGFARHFETKGILQSTDTVYKLTPRP